MVRPATHAIVTGMFRRIGAFSCACVRCEPFARRNGSATKRGQIDAVCATIDAAGVICV